MALLNSNRKKTVIILSSGRTGTTAIARVLNEGYRDVRAVHEPRPSRHLRIASFAHLAGRISKQRMVRLLFKNRQRLCERTQETTYVESNPFLVGFLEVLGDVFDSPQVVHIIRDPRTMVRSALNFGGDHGIKRLVSTLVPFWITKPEHFDRSAPQRWSQMSPVERFAWFWTTVNQHLNQGEKLYGDNYLRIRYEELFTPDGNGIRQLADWISLEPRDVDLAALLDNPVNRSRRQICPPWHQWQEEDRQVVLHHCGELMERYGYPDSLPDTNG